MTALLSMLPRRYSYGLEALLTTNGFKHNQAWIELVFRNDEGAVVKQISCPKYTTTKIDGRLGNWISIKIPPVTVPLEAVSGTVRVHVEAKGRGDMTGFAGFDDIRIIRLPRIRMESDQPQGLYATPAAPVIRCFVSGLAGDAQSIRFRLQDEDGRDLMFQDETPGSPPGQLVELESVQVEAEEVVGLPGELVDAAKVESGSVARWQLPELQPGFYRVKAALDQVGGSHFDIEHTIAVLADLPMTPGPFGWSMVDSGQHGIPIRSMPQWLANCRVHWIKYPCWVEPDDFKNADEIARLMGRLSDRNIQTVGVLCHPPESLLPTLNVKPDDPAAILFRDVETWQPMLEPVMARLTNGVQWWQLGDDRDFSFLGRAQLQESVDTIRTNLQGYGPPIRIVLNWPWLDKVPDREEWSWHAVCLSDPTPPTAAEIDSYFRSDTLASAPDAAATNGPSVEPPSPETEHETLTSTTNAGRNESLWSLLKDKTPATPAETTGRSGTLRLSQRPWMILEPLRHQDYPRPERVRDLILRMLSVRRNNIPAAFVSRPFHPDLKFLRPDGTPDEMLLPWRTSSALLSGLRPIGSLDLPNGSPNVLLANASTATLVVWTDDQRLNEGKPVTESFYIGPEAKHIDAYGRELEIKDVEVPSHSFKQQQIQVQSEPTFLVDIDRTAALWWLGIRLDKTRIDSLLGRPQQVRVSFMNPSANSISGSLQVDAPDSWGVDESPLPITAEPLRERHSDINITLGIDAKIGRAPMALYFSLDGDRKRDFIVWKTLDIGPEDIHITVSTRLVQGETRAQDRLIVRQEITNLSNRQQRFDCYVFAPGRVRGRLFATVPAGSTVVKEYPWPRGSELLGKTLRLRADQQDGGRTLNFEFRAHP